MDHILTVDELSARHHRGIGLALTAGVMWSLGGLLIKWVEWNPLAIAGARSAIAALVILIAVRHPRFSWSFAQVGGAIAYMAMVVLFVLATKLTTAANAILLHYTAPIYAALLGAWFLGERVTWGDWATIAVVFGGIALFFFDRLTVGGMWGNVCALGSGVAYAGVALFLRKQKDGSTLESALMGNILAALIGLPFMFQGAPGGSTWIGVVLLGAVQIGFSYVLYSTAIKYITVLEAVLLTTVEPILNPVWVFLALREAPGRWAILGGVIVLMAVTGRYAARTLRKQ